MPEFLDHTIKDPDSWREAKARMTPDRDRVDWARLEREYSNWRDQGAWVQAYFWVGFDVLHSRVVSVIEDRLCDWTPWS